MPLILHNVPAEELYVGEDGVQRPYAMLFPGNDGTTSRSRRVVPETGSFGKASTRRSRTKSQTPAAAKVVKEDPTLAAGDAIFSAFLAERATATPDPSQRQRLPVSASQPNLLSNEPSEGNTGPASRYVHKEPTEVIIRGFKATQQWAAIREYERIGGSICEDYYREPPSEQVRFKFDTRDPAVLRKRALTPEEKAKAFRYAGGETWIKITFESADAAEAAVDSSPQLVLGYMVYAEMYRGVPPTAPDEAIPAPRESRPKTPRSRTLGRSTTTPSLRHRVQSGFSPESTASSHTIDTGTLTTTSTAASTATIIGGSTKSESEFCTVIPTAKRIKLVPATQALMPQESYSQKFLSKIPLVNWFTSDIIGTTVPRTIDGQFDWARASLYWKCIWLLDSCTGWFDVVGDKED